MDNKFQYTIGADTSGFDAGLKQMASSMELVRRLMGEIERGAVTNAGATAQATARAVENAQALRDQAAAQQAFLRSLQERVETQGMSPDQLLRYRAAQLGVAEQAEALISRLNAQGRAGAAAAAQMANAMRMLPMQMTDIVTSLASGMPLWMVLIQQGGQLKDSFGGLGPMFRGIGTAIASISPTVAVLGALGVSGLALGVAFVQGQRESDAFALAVRNTGNAAGVSATQYDQLAKSAQSATGAAIGSAREAAQAAVASGEFGAAAIGPAVTAITAYAKATGATAEEAARNFKGIGRNVAEWAETQNRQFNFLTAETYAHIRALQEEGRTQEAAAIAMQALTQRLTEQPMQLGYIERALRATGNAWSDFWDKAKGLGRAETVGQQLDDVAAKLKSMDENRPQYGGLLGQRAAADWERERQVLTARQAALQEQSRLEQRAASMQAENADKQRRAIEAVKAVESMRDQTASPTEKREKELADYRRHAAALKAVGQEISADQQRRDEAAIADKYKDRKPAASGGKSRMGDFDDALAAERRIATERDALHGMSEQQVLAFWQRIASHERMSAADRLQVQKKVSEAKIDLLRKDAQQAQQVGQLQLQDDAARKITQVDAEAEAARQRQQAGKSSLQELLQAEIGFEQRRTEIRKQALEAQRATLDPERDVARRAQIDSQILAVELQGAQRVGQLRGQILRDSARAAEEIQMQKLRTWEEKELASVAVDEEVARRKQALGEIKKTVLLQQEAEFAERRANIRRQALAAQIDAVDPALDHVKYAQLAGQIEQLEMQHQVRMAQIRGQAAIESAREVGATWDAAGQMASGLWDKGVTAMTNGTLTWRNAQRAIGAEMVRWFLADVVKRQVSAWMLGETAKTSATVTGVTARGAAENAGAVQSVALWAMTAVKNIMSSAYEAMAGAYKAVVGIYPIGPVLAPIAAGVAFAGVAALASKVRSARGGYDIPAGINPMTQLHEQEMVLPARHANTIRALGDVAPRMLIPRGNPFTEMSEALIQRVSSGGLANAGRGDSAAGGAVSVPVTYNDHSGRLTPDDLRRNARTIGDIVTQMVRDNRLKPT